MSQSLKYFCLLLTAGLLTAEPLRAANLTWTNALNSQIFSAAGNWSGGTLSAGDNLTIAKSTSGTYPVVDATALPAYFGSITLGINNSGTLNAGVLEQKANTIEARNQVQIGFTHTGAILMTGTSIFKHTTAGNFYVTLGSLTLGRTGNATDNPTLNNTKGIFWLGNASAYQGTVTAYSGAVNNSTDVIVGYNNGTIGNLNLYERGAFHHDSGNGNFTLGYGAGATGNVTLGTDGATTTTPTLTNAVGSFYVGYGGGTGNVTAYAGTIATGGYDGIGSNGTSTGNLYLYGNAVFNHQSTMADFAVGQSAGTGILTMGRDGDATDNSTLNIAGGNFIVCGSTSAVNVYSGTINAHGGVVAGTIGAAGTINLYGTAKFVHDTAGDFNIGSGTLTLGRTGTAADLPTLNVNFGALKIAGDDGGVGNVIVNTGTITVDGTAMTNRTGIVLGAGYGANANVTVNAGGKVQFTGTWSSLGLGAGHTAVTEWKQEGGTTDMGLNPVIMGGHVINNGYSTNTLRLDGGTFATSRISPSSACSADELANIVSKIYFNGGKLQATAHSTVSNGNLIDRDGLVHFNAYVQLRGALIDSNGYNATIDIPLEADPTSPGGGLTKIGAGALTLTESPSYTGDTVVNVGELRALAGINSPSAKVYVATGAKLTAKSITANTLTIGGAPITPSAAAVPEPGTMALVLAALVIFSFFRVYALK